MQEVGVLVPPQATSCFPWDMTEREWPALPEPGKGGMEQSAGKVSMLVAVLVPPVITKPVGQLSPLQVVAWARWRLKSAKARRRKTTRAILRKGILFLFRNQSFSNCLCSFSSECK